MNSKTEELLQRTFDFGVNCLQFLDKLPKTKVYGIITFQLGKHLHLWDQIMKKLKALNRLKILYIKLESF